MTYARIYEAGKKELEEAGVREAALDARLLLEFVCGTKRHDLLAHGDRPVEREKEERYRELLARRAKRIPLQHLTGVQEFMGLEFQVGPEALIPRQDTEILVEEVMRELHDGFRILDLCTGSGCILLSLLHYSNGCEGVGTDLSPRALELARANARALGEEAAVFVESELFGKVEGKYEIIVSNPPYIRTEVIASLEEEVRLHEPMMALDGREDGLFFYREIVRRSPDYLCGGGRLYLEIGYDQKEEVTALMREAGFEEVTAVKDYAGKDRVVYGILPSLRNGDSL